MSCSDIKKIYEIDIPRMLAGCLVLISNCDIVGDAIKNVVGISRNDVLA
jgi:hypothetical protein